MIRHLRRLLRAGLAVLVLAAALPAVAGPIGFRNDTDGPIKVQGMSVINGVIRQGKSHTIQAGGTAWDVIIAPGNKTIIVTDAKHPTKILAQETIKVGGGTVFYSIQPNEDDPAKPPEGKKTTKEKNAPKVKLVSTKPPMGTPMGSSGSLRGR